MSAVSIRTDPGSTPVLVGAAAICSFVGLDTTMKFLVGGLPLEQAVFLRYAFAIPIVLVLFLRRPQRLTVASLRSNGLRGVLVVMIAMSFFYSISVLPLAEAMAIQFLAPFFIALFGRLILKEPLGGRVIIGLCIGFAGILVILWGQIGGKHGDSALYGALAALFAAACYGLSNVLVRRQSASDSVETIVLSQTIVASTLLAIPGTSAWQPLTTQDLFLFGAVCVFGTLGQFGITWALTRAPASRLAVLEYTAFLWASLFGWLVFGEHPTTPTLAGAAIIVGACLFALRPAPTRQAAE